MKPEDLDYIRYRLSTAEEALLEAQTLLEKGLLRGTLNRLYYACFYAVEALLWTEGLSSSKHSGVRALFVRHWIKAGRLPLPMGDLYREIFDARHSADYARMALKQEETEALCSEVRKFLAAVTNKVEEELKSDASQP